MTTIAETTKKTRMGMHAFKAKIALKGLQAIDGRTAAARYLLRWKEELTAALGDPSPQQLALIELCVRARAVLDHIDAYIMEQPSLINRRHRRVLPVVEQRTKIADHLAKMLAQLGLERIPKPVPTLQEYLAEKYPDGAEDEKSEIEHPAVDDGPGTVREDV